MAFRLSAKRGDGLRRRRWPEAERRVVEAGCPLGGFIHNIAEGSKVSGTSNKMELKLTNVARTSLEELKLDYEDFLRQVREGEARYP